MTKTKVIGAVVLMGIAGAARPASADLCDETPSDPCDTCFTATTGDWDVGANWSNGTPTASTVACVQTGKTVTIPEDYSAAAEAIITVDGSTVVIVERGVLTITEDSTVDGLVNLQGGKLTIAADLTITADGGEIDMSGVAVLDGTGVLTIDCDTAGKRATCLTVSGGGNFEVEAVNKGYVVADDTAKNMDLEVNTKSATSDGHWIAEAGGEMTCTIAISGAGEWELVDNANSVIRFTVSSTGLTGPFLIEKGDVKLFGTDVEVCTTGNLTFTSVAGSPDSNPSIVVGRDAAIRFGTACP